ncbi:MAG TPA: ABC transporter permease [Candidatus Angelobacter sp.]
MEVSGPIRGMIRWSSWLLRIASMLVPKAQRKQWYEQWRTQVWHWAHFLYESGRLNSASKRELAKHLWGAFGDAFWHRFDRGKVQRLMRESPRTPRFMLLAITGAMLAVVVATGFFPTIRWALSAFPYRSPDRLVNLSFNGNFIRYHPGTLFLTVSRWSQQSKTAEAIAAYSWEQGDKLKAGEQHIEVTGARVSPGFFDLLGVNPAAGRLFHPGDEKQCDNCIVISDWLWEHGFDRDPALVGRKILYQGSSSTVIGILPARFWFVSPEISVWTLSPGHARSVNLAERTGAVLRLRPGGTRAQADAELQNLLKDTGSAFGYARAELAPIRNPINQGLAIYLVFIAVAFIAGLVLLKLRQIRSAAPLHVDAGRQYRWWLFFSGKTALLLVTCFVLAVEGTRRVFLASTGSVPSSAGAVSSWFLLVSAVLAVTWSLHDQGRRCHICLKRLSHESYVGVPARLLLDWWGTELVCSQGHGMLHLPEMKASWLEEEQWIQLDESWKPLFEPDEAKV